MFSDKLINITKNIDKNRATKVELNATPRLSVIPDMSPAKASDALDKASPIPLTVPIKPIDGIAHEIYLVKLRSISNTLSMLD